MSPSTSSLILFSLLLATVTVSAKKPFNVCPGSPMPRRPGIKACKIRCMSSDPVCGADGVTYTCGCPEASCRGVRAVKKGPCTPPPPPKPANNLCGKASPGKNCEAIRCLVADPVCGVNGVTYACGCVEADCFGVAVAYKTECV